MKANNPKGISYPPAIATMLLLLVISPLPAQERLPAEELLRFFPMGDYESIDHEETFSLLAAKGLNVFNEFNSHYLDRTVWPLPADFLNEAESITRAKRVRIYVYVRKEGVASSSKERRSSSTAIKIGGESYVAEGVGENLYVMRFIDPAAVLKKYIESGEITETGQTLGSHSVYTIKHEDFRGYTWGFFLVATETGEMLAAESTTTLKHMLNTGSGEEVSILGDQAYLTCEELLAEPGQVFWWGTFENLYAAIVKYAEKKGAPEEEIDKVKESRLGPNRNVARSWLWDASSIPVVRKTISFYASDEGAFAAKQKWDSEKLQYTDEYILAVISASKYSLDGNRVLVSMTYDEETLETLREARKERNKMVEEMKQKEENKEKQDHQ